MLCADCEALFNAWETKFSREIFNPFCYGGALPSITYGDWLLKFCVSVSWRSLNYMRAEADFSHYNDRQLGLVECASETWAEFLLGRRKHPEAFEQHLALLWQIHSRRDTSQIHFRQCGQRCGVGRAMSSRMAFRTAGKVG